VGGKINVYNLGTLGVDLVRSPLHIPDGAWRQAQNAEFPDDEGEGGLKKRGSLTRLNTTALAGSIQSFTNVPLDTEAFGGAGIIPYRHLICASTAGVPNQWRASSDGTTYAAVAAITNFPDFPVVNNGRMTATVNRKMYFTTTNGLTTNLRLYSWDGTTFVMLKDFGAISTVFNTDLFVANGVVYIATYDSGGLARIYAYRPSTGALSQVGNALSIAATASLAFAYGRLFAGFNTTPGVVYSIDPDTELTWTLDETFAAGLTCYQLITFNGVLYAGTLGDGVGTLSLILTRDAAGTWTTSFTGATDDGIFWGFCEFNSDLYVSWYDTVNVAQRIYRLNAGAWAVNLDLVATFGENAAEMPGTPYVFDDALYYPYGSLAAATGYTIKRTTGGVWSRPVTLTELAPIAGVTGSDT
jgi:hypothetical protein